MVFFFRIFNILFSILKPVTSNQIPKIHFPKSMCVGKCTESVLLDYGLMTEPFWTEILLKSHRNSI